MDESLPETQPDGSLVPPPRVPPTALATSAPLPPRPSSSRTTWRGGSVRELAAAVLDRLDSLGDQIADAIGLR